MYFCLSFCRLFQKLMRDIDEEYMEDMFDLLIIMNLTDDEEEKPAKVYADQIGLC